MNLGPLGSRHRPLWIALGTLLAVAVTGTAALFLARMPTDASTTAPAESTRPATSWFPDPSETPTLATTPSLTTALLPGSTPTDSTLIGGYTNHLEFSEAVARALLAYGSNTDFQARNRDILRAALPDPLGDPASLADDLVRYTPAASTRASMREMHTRVTVAFTDISVSSWASKRLESIGARSGTYGVDISGTQTITTAGNAPIPVPIQLGVTVACPPATTTCGLDRVYPQHLQDALESK